MPASRVIELLDGDSVLLKAEQIMYFRPRGQCAVPADDGTSFAGINILKPSSNGHPIIALLDGLPQQNHPLLSDRLQMSKDTHDWEEEYPAKERQHGTATASLILHGDLTDPEVPLKHRLYVQPVMRPNPQSFKQPKPEEIPQDRLLLDLMHQSVNCLFEGERPEAPTVKVINLSLGDARRLFCGKLSP